MAKYRKLGKTSDQRKALLRNQVTALIYKGRIITTQARAKEVMKIADGLIALAVKEKDIFYFASDKKYSRLVGKMGEYFCDMGLQQLEEALGKKSFFRCHKSYLVNLGNVSEINKSVLLKNGESIPVSRRRVKELKEAYLAYIIRKARSGYGCGRSEERRVGNEC